MAYYAPLSPSTSIAMEQFSYPKKTSNSAPPSQKESFIDDLNRVDSNILRPPPRQNILKSALMFVWKTLFLPLTAFAYITFCYVCYFKLVRVGGISDPMGHLALIKSGVTSISILFVSLSLIPLSSLLSDLKSEEFFRTLSSKGHGAPLTSVNSISTPSYGMRDSIKTLYRRHASPYFAGALFASLLALAASTLAPAALSVDTVLFDDDLLALSVGAIQRNSVMNSSSFSQPQEIGPSEMAFLRNPEAGAVAWAEFSLGVNFSFQSPTVDQTAYIVPTPLKLSTGTKGRWISDVVSMQPTCEWIAPQFQTTGVNLSDFSAPALVMNLTSKNVRVTLQPSDIRDNNFGVKPIGGFWFSGLGGVFLDTLDTVLAMDTMDDLTDGSTVWVVHQCANNCDPPEFSDQPINITFGSEMNHSRFNSSDGKAIDVTFLYCSPNARIQTHQITNNGQGLLAIGDQVSTPQGNLHDAQTKLMLSFALNGFDTAGPQTATNISHFGSEVQFSFIFGKGVSVASTQFTPRSINDLSVSYGQLLKSAAKPFMDGSMATAYVPGRTTQEIVVFVSSLPHIIASTVLYIILSAFALVCHFRRYVPQFTFFAVAASLAKSEIPPLFAQLKESEHSPPYSEDSGVSALGGAHVLLDGGQVLKLRG